MGSATDERPTRVRYLVLTSLCAAAALAYIHRSCISVPAGLMQKDLRLSKEQLGEIMSAFYLGYTLFQIPGGWLGDRFGTRLTLSTFALCWSLATGLMGFGSELAVLAGLWLVNGMAQAGIFSCCVKTFAYWFPRSERGFPSGMLASFMSVGAVLATGLTGFLLAFLDWRTLFIVLAIPGFVFAFTFFNWFRDRPAQHAWVNDAELAYIAHEPDRATAEPAARTPWSSLAYSVPLYLVCAQQFFRAAAYIFYVTWFPNYLQESRGVSEEEAGLLASLPLIGVVCGSALSGSVIDGLWRRTRSHRISRQGVGLASVLAAGGCLFLASISDSLAAAAALIAAGAFFGGFSGPASYTVTIDLAGGHVATVFSIMNMAGNFGATLCPLVVGELIQNKEWSGVLLFLAGLYGAAALCWMFLNVRSND